MRTMWRSSSRPGPIGPQPTGKIESFSYLGSSKDKDKKKKDKKVRKSKVFNLEAEKTEMKTTIAESSMASTDLLNTLQSINREQERISQNPRAAERFQACKILRRKILRYVRHIGLSPLPPACVRHQETNKTRFTISNLKSGSDIFCTPTTSSSRR